MQLLSLRGAAGQETRLADVHIELLQTAIPVRINTAQEAEWMSARELGSLAACTSGVCTCVFVCCVSRWNHFLQTTLFAHHRLAATTRCQSYGCTILTHMAASLDIKCVNACLYLKPLMGHCLQT